MKKKRDYRSELPLADMHTDGIRFDPKIKKAMRNQFAKQSFERNTAQNAQ